MVVPNIKFRKLWLEKRREIGESIDLKKAVVEIRARLSEDLVTQLRHIGFSINVSEKAADVFSNIINKMAMELLKEIQKGEKV